MKPKIDTENAKPKRRRRRRNQQQMSVDAEIRQSARQIYESGLGEAMKAAALVVVARKLDEIRNLVVASGLSINGLDQNAILPGLSVPLPGAQPSPPPVAPPPLNPCVHCGRPGVYRSKPNPFNRTGSWVCRAHLPLVGQIEAEDRFDRTLGGEAPPPAQNPVVVPSVPPPSPGSNGPVAAGASSLAEAMGMAELVNE